MPERNVMIRIGQIKVPYTEKKDRIFQTLLKKLHLPEKEIISWSVFKKSVDARKKEAIMAVYTLDVTLKHENAF